MSFDVCYSFYSNCISSYSILFLDPLVLSLSLLYYISMSEPCYKNDDSCVLPQTVYLILTSISCLFIHWPYSWGACFFVSVKNGWEDVRSFTEPRRQHAKTITPCVWNDCRLLNKQLVLHQTLFHFLLRCVTLKLYSWRNACAFSAILPLPLSSH